MDESLIGKFCNTAAKFCKHLETSCSALKQSIERRPIPLDSASTTFVQTVNRRVSAAADDLNMLESMSLGTVSFEELLGHCNEVFKKNQLDIFALQDHLRSSSPNYIPSFDFDEEDILDDNALDKLALGSDDSELKNSNIEEEDPLLDDSLSLKNFGISDVSLATIASQDSKFEMDKTDFQPPLKSFEDMEGERRDELKPHKDCKLLLNVSRDDYESLPKHMKSLVSWEDLLVAVEKINSWVGIRIKNSDTIHQDEIEALGLGFKARSYLLLLIKMNRLCVETNGGVISYRILPTCDASDAYRGI